MESQEVKFQENFMEMFGNIKTLVSEFKHLNGSLIDTKARFDKHEDESEKFRKRVNIMWHGIIYSGWLLFVAIAVLNYIKN